MEKKSFIKGILLGVVASVLVCTGTAFAYTAMGYGKMSIDKKIGTLTALLDKYYVDEVDYEKLEEGLYKGLVDAVGDPYTVYMTESEYGEFMQDNDGAFSGIGVEISSQAPDYALIVVSPIEGSPAAKAGILPGDKIIKVDTLDVGGMDINEVTKKIKGLEGTNVKITVYRTNTNQTLDFDITRGKIDVQTVSSKMIENNIGYIKLSHFRSNTTEQFKTAYKDLEDKKMQGLILDLRNNPGGLLNIVEEIGDMLLPEGTMVYTIDKAGNREDFVSNKAAATIPICVLVNENSASASEILAGAIQDMKVGKLVGTQTFGKGLVQGLYPLSDGSGVKVTIQKYYTPRGVCIQGEGIAPDYKVELPEESKYQLNIEPSKDTQLKKAMEVIQTELK